MTLARAFGGGLSDLTTLNQRLIAQLAETDEDVLEAAGLLGGFGPEGQPEDPDTEDEEKAEVRGRFSTEDPFGFQRVKEFIEQTIFGGSPQGRGPLIGAFVNEWAENMHPDQESPFPAGLADQILGDEGFQTGAAWLPVREQLDGLPPIFRTSMENEDGEVVDFTVQNNPLTGPEFIEEQIFHEFVEARVPNLRAPSRIPIERVSDSASDRAIARAARGQTDQPVETPSDSASDRAIARAAASQEGPATVGVETIAASDRAIARAVNRNRAELPFIDGDALVDALQPQPSGGGGGTRRELVFDKDHLLSQVEDRWNAWMLSPDPAPSGQIGSWVDSYIREAKAFWSGKGGQLDFDTYITNKLENHPRYQTIYRHKQPGESPEQFLQKFMAPIAGLGMDGDFTREQTERSVTSGAGPAGQLERVRRTRDVQVANQGQFSQRLAQTLAGVGVG